MSRDSINLYPFQILKRIFQRKHSLHKGFSLRRLAQMVDLSPSHLSRIFQGKKRFPQEKFDLFAKALELDEIQVIELKKSILYDQVKTNKSSYETLQNLLTQNKQENSFLNSYEELNLKQYQLLSHWYNVAILDLTTCVDFNPDPQWIAKRLRVNTTDVKISIQQLLEAGLLAWDEKQNLVKTNKNLRVPGKRSSTYIRKFHQSMIEKALWTLQNQQSEIEFKQRLITGITIATNPEHLEKAKAVLQSAIHEAASILSEGPCTHIYQLNLQLFGLTSEIEHINTIENFPTTKA